MSTEIMILLSAMAAAAVSGVLAYAFRKQPQAVETDSGNDPQTLSATAGSDRNVAREAGASESDGGGEGG